MLWGRNPAMHGHPNIPPNALIAASTNVGRSCVRFGTSNRQVFSFHTSENCVPLLQSLEHDVPCVFEQLFRQIGGHHDATFQFLTRHIEDWSALSLRVSEEVLVFDDLG